MAALALDAFPPGMVAAVARYVVGSLSQTDTRDLSAEAVEWSTQVLLAAIKLPKDAATDGTQQPVTLQQYLQATSPVSKTPQPQQVQPPRQSEQTRRSTVAASASTNLKGQSTAAKRFGGAPKQQQQQQQQQQRQQQQERAGPEDATVYPGNVAHGALNVLTGWLSLSVKCPVVVQDDPARFLVNVLNHIVRLFRDDALRPGSNQCRRVFQALNQLASHCKDPGTVIVALRALLSIADEIMRTPSALELALRVCDNLLPTLLEVWIKVCARHYPSPELWAELTARFRSWRSWAKAATWWGLVVRRLTQRVVDVLYASPDKKTKKKKKISDPLEEAVETMPVEVLFQCWRSMLRLLADPAHLSPQHFPPDAYTEVVDNVAALVDIFLTAQQPSKQRQRQQTAGKAEASASSAQEGQVQPPYHHYAPPTVDSMLALFGQWLFEAASPDTGEACLQARACGTGALVAIFTSQQLDPPPPLYLHAFVGLVTAGLREELVAQHILQRGTQLFINTHQQQHLWVTIPPLVGVIRQVLTGGAAASRSVRLSAATILQTLACYPNHIGHVPTKSIGVLESRAGAMTGSGTRTAAEDQGEEEEEEEEKEQDGKQAQHKEQKGDKTGASGEHAQSSGGGGRRETTFSAAPPRVSSSPSSSPSAQTPPTPPAPPSWFQEVDAPFFSSFTRRFGAICMRAIETEEDEAILQTLMNTIYTVILDDETKRACTRATHSLHHSNSDSSTSAATPESVPAGSEVKAKPLPPLLIVSTLRMLVRNLCKRSWSLPVQMTALETIRGLARLFDIVMEADRRAAPDLILGLCRFIEMQLGQPRQRHTRKLHTSIVVGYHCLLSWMSPYWCHDCAHEVLAAVLRVVMCGLVGASAQDSVKFQSSAESRWILGKGPPRRKRQISEDNLGVASPSYRVQEAASLLLRKLHSAHVSPAQQRNPAITANSEFRAWSDANADIRYFSIGMHTVLAVFAPRSGSDTAFVIVRDESGRTVWRLRPDWTPRSTTHAAAAAHASAPTSQRSSMRTGRKSAPTFAPPSSSLLDTISASSLNARLEEITGEANPRFSEAGVDAGLQDAFMRQKHQEQVHALDQDELIDPEPRREPARSVHYSVARQFLASLFFFNIVGAQSEEEDLALRELDMDTALSSQLVDLDEVSRGDVICVRAAYLPTDGCLQDMTLPTTMDETPEEFFAFFHDLRTAEPIGYQEADVNFRDAATKQQAPLVVSETTRMRVTLHDNAPLPKHAPVHVVVWCQSLACVFAHDSVAASLLEEGAHLVLFVAQQPGGLLSVHKYAADSAAVAGPLPQATVVGEHVLAESIRETITNTFLRRAMADDKHVLPSVVRKKAIKELIQAALERQECGAMAMSAQRRQQPQRQPQQQEGQQQQQQQQSSVSAAEPHPQAEKLLQFVLHDPEGRQERRRSRLYHHHQQQQPGQSAAHSAGSSVNVSLNPSAVSICVDEEISDV